MHGSVASAYRQLSLAHGKQTETSKPLTTGLKATSTVIRENFVWFNALPCVNTLQHRNYKCFVQVTKQVPMLFESVHFIVFDRQKKEV